MPSKLRNIKLTIEYDGTGYAGWQTQDSPQRPAVHGPRTIQGTTERILSQILNEKVKLIASGRTDSGVHAKGQVANFKTSSNLSPAAIQKALNACLPRDISVLKAKEVELDFHSRFCARSKRYRYVILNRTCPSAMGRDYFHFVPYPLDVELIRNEARSLVGRHDFRSFEGGRRRSGDSKRNLMKLEVKGQGPFIFIDVEADGFLYNMVRNIAGTLLEVGRGKLPPGSTRRILRAKNREKAGPTAPAKGLCLMEVRYNNYSKKVTVSHSQKNVATLNRVRW